MFRVWTKNLGRVGKSEAHVYFLALICSDAEQLGKPFLLKGNFFCLFLNSMAKNVPHSCLFFSTVETALSYVTFVCVCP